MLEIKTPASTNNLLNGRLVKLRANTYKKLIKCLVSIFVVGTNVPRLFILWGCPNSREFPSSNATLSYRSLGSQSKFLGVASLDRIVLDP